MTTSDAAATRTRAATNGATRTRTTVTGWQLRGVLLALVLAAVALVVVGEVHERLGVVSLVGTVLLVVATVALPGSLGPTLLLLALGGAALGREVSSLPLLMLLAALMHAIHLVAGMAALGPPTTRFEVSALVPSARRWALSQALAVPVVVVVWWARSGGAATGVSDRTEILAGVVAVLVLFATAGLARRRMR
ncbi:MAG TPA: hypothetical protein VFX33_14840 [Actinomycetales bacterium]|nr:hypothetical protein [Actinomycetales bacterium]